MVFWREQLAEWRNVHQVDLSPFEQLENDGEPGRHPRRRDAVIRLIVAETELFLAILEQRLRLLQSKPPRVHLSKVRDDARLTPPLGRDELPQPTHQLLIRN